MWDGRDFRGAKIALVCDGLLVAYLRDDKPIIPYPNLWDLPGGGREGDESPIDCVLRETEEEFGIRIRSDGIMWQRYYPGRGDRHIGGYFLAANITPEIIHNIRFGNEGQFWKMMPVQDFINHPQAVPNLKIRLSDYIDSVKPKSPCRTTAIFR